MNKEYLVNLRTKMKKLKNHSNRMLKRYNDEVKEVPFFNYLSYSDIDEVFVYYTGSWGGLFENLSFKLDVRYLYDEDYRKFLSIYKES